MSTFYPFGNTFVLTRTTLRNLRNHRTIVFGYDGSCSFKIIHFFAILLAYSIFPILHLLKGLSGQTFRDANEFRFFIFLKKSQRIFVSLSRCFFKSTFKTLQYIFAFNNADIFQKLMLKILYKLALK